MSFRTQSCSERFITLSKHHTLQLKSTYTSDELRSKLKKAMCLTLITVFCKTNIQSYDMNAAVCASLFRRISFMNKVSLDKAK